jgi:threonine dehydratase
MDGVELVTLEDIRAAAERIRGAVINTPLLPCPWSSADHPLWLKPESLQAIGSFKIRGAFNAVARLSAEERRRGVVAHSSGNHAQALGYAARAFGVPAVIVVPDNAPAVKIEATLALGAEVVLVPMAERMSAAEAIAAERGATLIPPFDHLDVIAGQGTVGLEIATELPDVELVLVPVGGGGLASGVATAVKALCPGARVIGVEPELAADTQESLHADRLVRWTNEQRARTIADGVRTEPSELTFAHLQKLLDDIVTVSEDDIRRAIATLATRARLVAEPAGAVATAAYLTRTDLPRGRTVAVITGGNIDPQLLAACLAS